MGVLFERGMDVDVPHWLDIFDNEKFEQLLAECGIKSEGKASMEDKEALKAEMKKLSARAVEASMALHDLSEDLPAGLEMVMDVARKKLAAATA